MFCLRWKSPVWLDELLYDLHKLYLAFYTWIYIRMFCPCYDNYFAFELHKPWIWKNKKTVARFMNFWSKQFVLRVAQSILGPKNCFLWFSQKYSNQLKNSFYCKCSAQGLQKHQILIFDLETKCSSLFGSVVKIDGWLNSTSNFYW